MEFIPDPRTVIEDDVDRQRFERDAEERMRRAEEAKQIKIAQAAARKEEKLKRREMLLAAKENGEEDEDASGQESDSQMSGSRSKARTGETGSA